MDYWQQVATSQAANRDAAVRAVLSSPEAVHDLLDAFYPTAGGAAAPLATPGSPAGTGMDKLALLTGGGWENLYFAGPDGNSQEANDAFFADLVDGAEWDDVQYQMLTTEQFFGNPSRLG
jgi:hypothetical protein